MKKTKKNKFGLKEQYKKCWKYIKESKNFIYTVIILFFVSGLIGFFFPVPQDIYNKILEFIQQIIKDTENLGYMSLIKYILLNNIKTSFYGMVLGIFFGIFPVIAVIVNGYLLGFVSNMSVQSESIFVLWRLLPHGIFELPAVFISFALGIKLGTILFKNNKMEVFEEYVKESFRIFLFVILPLLIIAAIIEGTLIFLGK
jgi:stage II sporulation protein M